MATAGSTRSYKRAAADGGHGGQPTAGAPLASEQSNGGTRVSSAASKGSTASRRQNPGQQLSQIEKSVTHLLIATKQLLETLTQWSRHSSTEGEVSDVYVRLGYEFNIACRAFNGIGVDTSDLGPVPELLRAILEETLSQEASPASLDRYLPRIRDIIINLLHGLKRKQQRLRAKQSKDSASADRVSSSTSATSLNSAPGPANPENQRNSSRESDRHADSRTGNLDGANNSVPGADTHDMSANRRGPTRSDSGGIVPQDSIRSSKRQSTRAPGSSEDVRSIVVEDTSSAAPPEAIQNDVPNVSSQPSVSHFDSPSNLGYLQSPPPPPPPKQQDALAALQRGGDLERRASRRYSAYQISKHLGASPSGMPMLPPAQNSPVPNRGRDVRESMNAVKARGSGLYSRQRSRAGTAETSPNRVNNTTHRISDVYEEPMMQSSLSDQGLGSHPATAQNNDGLRDHKAAQAPMTASIHDFAATQPEYVTDVSAESGSHKLDRSESAASVAISPDAEQGISPYTPEQSPQPGKELTLFLQYKSKIKKFTLADGSTELSIPRLQLAFIEKFAWNTHNNGIDLPEIYIQDPISGVRHELEELGDVKERSVLVLNVEPLDEVKKHFDESFGDLRKVVEGVKTVLDGQRVSLEQVSEHQQTASRQMQRLSLRPENTSSTSAMSIPARQSVSKGTGEKLPNDKIQALQTLRQDVDSMRSAIKSLVSEMSSSMATVKSKAANIKTIAVEGIMPDLDSNTGRAYVNNGKKCLTDDSEKIVNQVDDLQDIVEDLRKDVVHRGVRPMPRQLENVSRSISVASTELSKLQEYLRREKPVWTKIWEKELEIVCNDRDLLTMQEELATDLQDDLEKATQTFALVEEATKQQNIQQSNPSSNSNPSSRSVSRGLSTMTTSESTLDPLKAKDSVLGEVRALRPNHETRLEAIERAERARRKDLESREGGALTQEIVSFVQQSKFKKSGGGVEALEEARQKRDEMNMRNAWDVQQARANGVSNVQDVAVANSGSDFDPDQPIDPRLGGGGTKDDN